MVSHAVQSFEMHGLGAVPPTADDCPRALCEAGASKDIFVERASAERLASIAPAWRDLVARALEPNVFMDPGLLHAAVASAPKRKFAILLAWDSNRADARLLGVWGGMIGRALLPLRVLRMPAGPHSYLATPVLDRRQAAAVLHAMLDAVAAATDLPNILSATPMRADGPTLAVLRRVMAVRAADLHVFARWQRPLLQSNLDGAAYFAAAKSTSTRKKLRQCRRKLGERGALVLQTLSAPAAISPALEQFFALEAAGWKGRRGSALNCSAADTAFARRMIAALSARGDARIYALYLDGRPVSMQIVLGCHGAAFAWKTTYDEDLHDVSPGMLLLEDSTTALLADPTVSFADSCAFDENGFMAAWREREALAALWIDARRGGSPGFSACAGAQAMALQARGLLKRLYGLGMRTWTKRRS